MTSAFELSICLTRLENLVLLCSFCCCPNDPVIKYIFKENNKNTRKRCEICSKLTVETTERHQWDISHLFKVSVVYSECFKSKVNT